MHRISAHNLLISLSVLSAASLLAACDSRDFSRTAGQGSDTVVAQAERKMDNAANKTGTAAKDMAITAEMKMKLAADDALKATRINVDTSGGQVTLRGTAPDIAAKDHATDLAKSISGVGNVDNQLTVK